MKKLDNKNNENRSILKRCGHKSNTDVGTVDISTDFINRIIHEKKGSGDYKENEIRQSYEDNKEISDVIRNKNKKKNLHVSFCDDIIKEHHIRDNDLEDKYFVSDNDSYLLKQQEDQIFRFGSFNIQDVSDNNQELDDQSLSGSDTKSFESSDKSSERTPRYSEPFRFTAEEQFENSSISLNSNSWGKKAYNKQHLRNVFEFTEDVLEPFNDYNSSYSEKSPDKIGRFTLIAVNVDDTLKEESKENDLEGPHTGSIFEKNLLLSDLYKEGGEMNHKVIDRQKKEFQIERDMSNSSDDVRMVSPVMSSVNMRNYYYGLKEDSFDYRDGILEGKMSNVQLNQIPSKQSKENISEEEKSIEAKRNYLCNLYGISDDDSSRIGKYGGSQKDYDYELSTNIDWCSDYLDSSSSQGLDHIDIEETDNSKGESLEECVAELLKDIRAYDEANSNKPFTNYAIGEEVISRNVVRETKEISVNNIKNELSDKYIVSNTDLQKKDLFYKDKHDIDSTLEFSKMDQKSCINLRGNDSTPDDVICNKTDSEKYMTPLSVRDDSNASSVLLFEPLSSSFVNDDKMEQSKAKAENIGAPPVIINSKDNLNVKEVMNGSFKYPIKKESKANSWYDVKNNSIWIPWKEIFPVHKVHLHYPQRGIWWTSVPLVYYSRHMAEI